MRPELSIIIPVYREADLIGSCLTRISQEQGLERCEIIVVDGDNGSTRTPRDIVPVHSLTSPPGRGTQLAAGVRESRAPGLLFLHVDTELPEGFIVNVIKTLAHRPAGAFDLYIASRNPIVRLISVVGCMRSRVTRIPYGDQAPFVRRDVYDSVGGFPCVPILEDVILMERIKAAGHRISFLRPPARTSDRRWMAEGSIRTTLRNWALMRAYHAGVAVEVLAERYRPQSELSP